MPQTAPSPRPGNAAALRAAPARPRHRFPTKGSSVLVADEPDVGLPPLQLLGELRPQCCRAVAQPHSLQALIDRRIVLGQLQQHLRQRLRILARQEPGDLFPCTDGVHAHILRAPRPVVTQRSRTMFSEAGVPARPTPILTRSHDQPSIASSHRSEVRDRLYTGHCAWAACQGLPARSRRSCRSALWARIGPRDEACLG